MRLSRALPVFGAFFILLVSSLGVNSAFAGAEVIFVEDFDDTLDGWSQSICHTLDASQSCSILQSEFAQHSSSFHPLDPAISEPYWGVVKIFDSDNGTCSGPVEVRYSKEFVVPSTGEYNLETVIGVTNCAGCIETATLYIDGIQIFQRAGINANIDPTDNQTVFLESFTMNLDEGTHSIELGLGSTVTCNGNFQAAFDNIVVRSVVPPLTCGEGTVEDENQCVVDPTIIQQIIDLEALILELQNIIAELEALLGIHAPFTEEECDEIKATVAQKEADGRKVPSKLSSNFDTCVELYGE